MNKIIQWLFIPLVILYVLVSCNVNNKYINRIEDKKEALKILDKFYTLIETQKYDSLTVLFSKVIFENTDETQLKNVFITTFDKLGQIKRLEINHWETVSIDGENPTTNYFFIFENRYERYSATEQIRLKLENDTVIRIVSYNIKSEGLME